MTDALALVGAGLLTYLGHCFWRPWKTCPKCKGNPRNVGYKGTFNVSCMRCDSNGRLRRWGSKLIRVGMGKL